MHMFDWISSFAKCKHLSIVYHHQHHHHHQQPGHQYRNEHHHPQQQPDCHPHHCFCYHQCPVCMTLKAISREVGQFLESHNAMTSPVALLNQDHLDKISRHHNNKHLKT